MCIRDRIKDCFPPRFNPAEEAVSPPVQEVNRYVLAHAGYSVSYTHLDVYKRQSVSRYYEQAQKLKAQIQQDYWDKIDRFFYNIDCQDDFEFTTCQSITCLLYTSHIAKLFDSFHNLLPGFLTETSLYVI